MPFKLKLKRTKRYEVSSKNVFVVGVHMLDNSYMECTLKADSTGHNCMERIAHMIRLEEMQYFGLRYVTKKLQFRWINLEKPLKRQLDKHAHNPPRLYFGVMFYVTGAHKIEDDRARYYYFLQLKADVIDSRISCSPEQAVRLAVYNLQVELGDHDPDSHTLDYFREYQILPKNMTKDESTVVELMTEVLQGHYSMTGIHPLQAEIQYIKEVQLLDGYGMEYYLAKDENGKELYLGTSCVGIFVQYLDGQQSLSFRWTEIAHVVQNKKVVVIDTQKTSIQYHLEDNDTAKYFQQISTAQQKFYKCLKPLRDPPQIQYTQFDVPDVNEAQVNFTHSQDLKYKQGDSQTVSVSEEYSLSQQSLDNMSPDVTQHCLPAEPDIMTNSNMLYTPPQPAVQIQTSQPDPSYQQRLSLLPAYRPSPDYHAVMRQRIVEQSSMQPESSSVPTQTNSQVYSVPTGITYSEPDIPRDPQYFGEIQNYSEMPYVNVNEGTNYIMYRPAERVSNLIIQPTYSSPELNTQGLPQHYSSENMINDPMSYHFKPPPPYPRVSSSTPDLAVQTVRTNVNNSPDLVSRKNLGLTSFVTQSKLDKSLENLAAAFPEARLSENKIQMLPDSHQGVASSLPDTVTGVSIMRSASKTQQDIHIRYVGPKEAPPPSTSKEVATLRESFRRMMIARSSPSTHSRLKEKVAAAMLKEDSVSVSSSSLEKFERIGSDSSTSQESQQNKMSRTDEDKADDPTSEQYRPTSASWHAHQLPDCATEESSLARTDPIESGRQILEEAEEEQDYALKRKSIGPLKMAAMNGLTLSRPIILAANEDESRAPKDERRKLLECKLSEGRVFAEFEQIAKKAPNMDCSVGRLEENEPRNRFRDVLPYDDTRVQITTKQNNPAGYINASHVKLSLGKLEWWFIAVQAPLKDTVQDFWQMVWEQEVDVIAMLTALSEQGKEKCYPYWPQEPGAEHRLKFGQFEIMLHFSNDSLCYITSRICVKHLTTGRERLVWHLQYTDWPDHGCPDDTYGFLGYLDEVESVQRLAESEEGSGKKSPIIVHCSAGVGRTGVVILTNIMKSCLEHNLDVDIPRALACLRQQRMHMVQTLKQYSFVYKTLIQYLKNTRLI